MTTRFCLAVLLAATPAFAAPPALPGDESGRIDARREETDSNLRRLARGALFVPRLASKVAFAPFEGAIWALDRYQLRARAHRLFWNDAETIGLLPTLQVDAGFGANAGAHFVARASEGEQLDIRASAGGRFRRNVALSINSGKRFERLALESHVEHQRRPQEPFYGIGNADDPDVPLVAAVDPFVANGDAQFRHELTRAVAVADVRLAKSLRVRASGAVANHVFAGTGAENSIDARYETADLRGFDGYHALYSELELRWDTRRAYDRFEPASHPSTGGLVSAFAGRMHGIDDGSFWRYGADVQRFVRLAAGPRVLAFRLHAEGVTGSLEDVPFYELPRLGGKDYLRGYVADRFRDRLAIVGSVEYRWDLAKLYSASLFVDTGRVYHEVSNLELRDLRVGYGVALEAVSDASFLARISVASSTDGGLFVNLAFDPVFDLHGRVQR
jgi:hypothetical protein